MDWQQQIKKIPNLGLAVFILIAAVIAYYLGSRTGKAAVKNSGKTILKSALTYELAQYSSMADRLYSAMFGITDDEDAIYSVFTKLRTTSDLYQLIESFGKRRPMFYIGNADLPTWLNQRLSKSEIEHINSILSRNNINYQF